MSLKYGVLYEHFLEGMTVGVMLMAVGLFGLCVTAKEPRINAVKSVVVTLSKASFCIYLIHIFFLSTFTKHGFTVDLLPCAVSIPHVSLCIVFPCLCVYLILSKIPLVRKWLV